LRNATMKHAHQRLDQIQMPNAPIIPLSKCSAVSTFKVKVLRMKQLFLHSTLVSSRTSLKRLTKAN
jgi:hypothetical protein